MASKIGIITFHFAHNAGAMLQAYALSNMIGRKTSCEIINYQPEYHVKRYRLSEKYYHPKQVYKSILYKKKHSLKNFGKAVINYSVSKKNPVYINARAKNKAFIDFMKSLPLSKICYSKSAVEKLRGFSKYIVGSDQVWNKNIFDGEYDPVYFLDFCTAAKKYSYAVSSEDNLSLEDIQKIKQMTQSFSGVSVREKLLYDQLIASGVDCHMDIDPTLLLDQDDYFELEKPIQINESFIFVYCFEANKELCDLVKHLKNKLQCSVVVWGKDEEIKLEEISNVRYLTSVGPAEFLYCIHNACYVVTASFHGTAFSVIYRKQFAVMNPIIANNRIKTLLETLHLEKHKYSNYDSLIFDETFSECEVELRKKRDSSQKYIMEICQ